MAAGAPLGCPPGCPDKAAHEAYFREFAAWTGKLKAAGFPVPVEPAGPHGARDFGTAAASHEKDCLLNFGCRALVSEIATSMSEIIKLPAARLLSKVEFGCIPTGSLVCQTRMHAAAKRNRIEFSHGFHFFCLNAAVLVLAAAREREGQSIAGEGRPPMLDLLLQQVSFFWNQTPIEALAFPYWTFDPQVYAIACELAFLMIAFLMAHELAHSALVLTGIDRTTIDDVDANARRFLDVIPPPFLDGDATHPDWKRDWREELTCDGLAMWALLLCAPGSKGAVAGAPQVGERAQSERYLAFEAMTQNIEMLYLANTMAGHSNALRALYSPTHPLPNIRRTFLRGLAQQVDPRFVHEAARYGAILKGLAGSSRPTP